MFNRSCTRCHSSGVTLLLNGSYPEKFRANFIIWFSWQPKPGQNWSADKVKFTNAFGDPGIKVAIWTKPDPQLPGHERIANLGKLLNPVILILTIILLIPATRVGQASYSEGHENMQFKDWHP